MGNNKNLHAIISDIHVPYHDMKAIDKALKRIDEEKPGKVILLGDIADFEAISRFSRKLDKRAAFWQEVELVKGMLTYLEKRLKGCEIHYLTGNHESRLSKYIVRNCPELAGVPSLAFRELLEIPKRWQVYEYNLNAVVIDDISYLHGNRFSGNICGNNLKRYMGSVVQGHSHSSSAEYHRLPNGKVIGAVVTGCLCDLDPGYTSDVRWTHAMGWAENGLPYLEML